MKEKKTDTLVRKWLTPFSKIIMCIMRGCIICACSFSGSSTTSGSTWSWGSLLCLRVISSPIDFSAKSLCKILFGQSLNRLLAVLSATARFSNAFFLLNYSHASRILICTILMLMSYLLLALSLMESATVSGFYWSLVSCCLHGFSQSLGEATLMGYLKALPSDLVQTFGSGTGLSGFAGIFAILILQGLGMSHAKVSMRVSDSI